MMKLFKITLDDLIQLHVFGDYDQDKFNLEMTSLITHMANKGATSDQITEFLLENGIEMELKDNGLGGS